jgi:hypothetical protein
LPLIVGGLFRCGRPQFITSITSVTIAELAMAAAKEGYR